MPVDRRELEARHGESVLEDRVADLLRLVRRVEPVGVEGDDQELRRHAPERLRQLPRGPGEVEDVDRLRDAQVRVGVEPAVEDEDLPLVPQVPFHREFDGGVVPDRPVGPLPLPPAPLRPGELPHPAELLVHLPVREVGDEPHHPRHGQAAFRDRPPSVIVALVELGVGEDRRPADVVEGDLLRRMARGRRDRDGRRDAVRVVDRPLERLHPSHRPADDRQQALDAEVVEKMGLRAHHVADRHDGERQPVRPPRSRVDRGRPRAAVARSDHVRADDEIFLRVQRAARTDQEVPPPRLLLRRILPRKESRRVGAPGEGVLDQDGVAPLPVELPVRLVGERDGPELPPDVEGHLVGRLGEGEPLRLHETDRTLRQVGVHGGDDTKRDCRANHEMEHAAWRC